MFRYIAVAWDDARPGPGPGVSAKAEQLGQELQAWPGWEPALICPGLRVFTTGASSGVNDAQRLPGDRGVVLGKLFRRHNHDYRTARQVKLSDADAHSVISSGGASLVNDFWGRYIAFIRLDSGASQVLRDPNGTLPCFLIRQEGVSIVFSWLEDVLRLADHVEPPQVDWKALTALMQLGTLTGRATALAGVRQLLPGEALDLQQESSTLLWSAVEVARSSVRPRSLEAGEPAELLKLAVQSCTRAWASCYEALLLRLSGGVDSSILLSCLTPSSTAADVICINYHSPGSDSDERHFARLAAARAGRDLIERERDGGYRLERILQIARMPEPVPYIGWMNAGTDARLAAAYAAPAMFTGAGGDSLFFEFTSAWPAADYLRTQGLDAGFMAAAMDAARLGRVSVWRVLALALQALASSVHPGKSASTAPAPLGSLSQASLLAKDLLVARHIAPDLIHPQLHDSLRLPIGKRMQTLALMTPIGYYDPFEQSAAPELVNPLLSQPLVELCLRLPTWLLTQGGHGRALARRAFAPDLAPQIATRRSKGGMEEHIKAVLQANIDLVRGLLLEGQLNRRGMLDRSQVEALLSSRPTGLQAPLSQIHALVAMEAWLARWPI